MSVKNFSNTVDVTKLGIPKIEAEIADLSSKVLPDVTSADNGKVLKVAEGAWGVGTDNSLPDVTSADNGKVLKVSDGEWGVGYDNSLPEVTSADEGKIIQVNSSGEWAVNNLPGGGVFIIYAYTNANNTSVTCKDYSTWGDAVTAAINSGLPVIAMIASSASDTSYRIYNSTNKSDNSITFQFLLDTTANDFSIISFAANTSATGNTRPLNTRHRYALPTFSSSDNGKILQVVSGNASWVDLNGNNDQ